MSQRSNSMAARRSASRVWKVKCCRGQVLQLRIVRRDGAEVVHPLTLRLDTPSEIAYAQRGGILPYVLDTL